MNHSTQICSQGYSRRFFLHSCDVSQGRVCRNVSPLFHLSLFTLFYFFFFSSLFCTFPFLSLSFPLQSYSSFPCLFVTFNARCHAISRLPLPQSPFFEIISHCLGTCYHKEEKKANKDTHMNEEKTQPNIGFVKHPSECMCILKNTYYVDVLMCFVFCFLL